MKKGVLPLETLVKFIPHAIVLIVVFVVFVGLINTFLAKDLTPEMKDFERVLSEMDYIMSQPNSGQTQSIIVPVQGGSNLDIRYFGAGNIVKECNKKPCLCLNSGGSAYCKVYPELSNSCTSSCNTICSLNAESLANRNDKYKITITRTCNEITLS